MTLPEAAARWLNSLREKPDPHETVTLELPAERSSTPAPRCVICGRILPYPPLLGYDDTPRCHEHRGPRCSACGRLLAYPHQLGYDDEPCCHDCRTMVYRTVRAKLSRTQRFQET